MISRGSMNSWTIFFTIFLMSLKRVWLEGDVRYPTKLSRNVAKQGGELILDDEPGLRFTETEMKKFKLWPKGNVPYYIDVVSFSDKVLRNRIHMFLNGVSSITNLTFLELSKPPEDPDNTRWVFFLNRRGLRGCAFNSVVNFTNSGVQPVILGYDCLLSRELPRAVLAIAGIPDQHNAPDRDTYVIVEYENLLPDKKYLYAKLSSDDWLFQNLIFDYDSIGKLRYLDNTKNGQSVMLDYAEEYDEYMANYKKPNIVIPGNTFGYTMSQIDIKKIKMLYNYIGKEEINTSYCKKLFKNGNNFNLKRTSLQKTDPRKIGTKYCGTALNSQMNDTFVSREKKWSNAKSSDLNGRVETNSKESSDKQKVLDTLLHENTDHEIMFLKGQQPQNQKRKTSKPSSLDSLSRESDHHSDRRKLRARMKNKCANDKKKTK